MPEETAWFSRDREKMTHEQHAKEFLVLTLVDEHGVRLFADGEGDELFQKLDGGLIRDLVVAAYKANHIVLEELLSESSKPTSNSKTSSSSQSRSKKQLAS